MGEAAGAGFVAIEVEQAGEFWITFNPIVESLHSVGGCKFRKVFHSNIAPKW